MEAIKQPRYEDFEITHLGPAKKNRWAFLGMGTVPALVEKGDVSPYLNVNELDPAWMKAMGIDAKKIEETKMKELQAKQEEQEEKGKSNVENTSIS